MVSFPPHTSHKLQSLDRTFFKPLKEGVAELFQQAYLKAATMESAASEFSCTGIVPFNPKFLPIIEYLHDPR